MSNDSSTGGYIAGTVELGLADAALDALLQQMVAGITGIDGTLVRPRWQPTVPKQPEPDTNWCAIGVTSIDVDDFPAEVHDPEDDGSDDFAQWETINLLASFYGPAGMRNAKTLRAGIYVTQNRDAMVEQGIDLIDAGTITAAPAQINNVWVHRFDLPIRLRAKNELVFPILNLLTAQTAVVTDQES